MKAARCVFVRANRSLNISILCDSQTPFNKHKVMDNKVGQALKAQIYQKFEWLV